MTCVIHNRTSAAMREVADDTASLVFTGPPYWPPSLERDLFHPPKSRRRADLLAEALLGYAGSHLDVFRECFRVLGPGKVLVVQSRDIRLGRRLIGVAPVHRGLAEQAGFQLFTRYLWQAKRVEPDREREAKLSAAEGYPRPVDSEEFLVFMKPGIGTGSQVSEQKPNLRLLHPFLRTRLGRIGQPHPHQAPVPICEMFIKVYTTEGELVVDPFAGHGTTLIVASRLGRQAIGFEIDYKCVEICRSNTRGRFQATR